MTRTQFIGGGAVVTGLAMMATACALAACGPLAGPAGGGGDMASSGDMANGTGGNGGGAGSGGGDMAMPVSTMLPFVVDTAFVTSGYMGDGNMAGPIMMVPTKMGDSTDCNGKRASTTALGACHVITYTPPAMGGAGWGGVYWQYPADNWGKKPGYGMPSGAKKVTFQAMGAKDGMKVTFLAGGIVVAGNSYTDSLNAKAMVVLTTSWAPYSIDLSGQSYSEVLGGFGWSMAATEAVGGGTFYVDDIQWQ